MHIATISSQRQVTLPQSMLAQLSLDVKDTVGLTVDSNRIIMEPKRIKVEDLYGSLGSKIHPSKRNVPFEVAKKEAIRIVVKELANE